MAQPQALDADTVVANTAEAARQASGNAILADAEASLAFDRSVFELVVVYQNHAIEKAMPQQAQGLVLVEELAVRAATRQRRARAALQSVTSDLAFAQNALTAAKRQSDLAHQQAEEPRYPCTLR